MKKEDNKITFSDIIDFTKEILDKYYPLEEQSLVPLQNPPCIERYLFIPAIFAKNNNGIFTGILEDSSVKAS